MESINLGLRGQNLIFIISQMRAGSTMLQRMMGSHPEIHTASEPTLMLHPVYALRSKGYKAEYDANLAHKALERFLVDLPEGEEAYIEGIRRMYSYLYERALTSSGKRYFLDKTPRYYLIIPELQRIFPEAHFIVLLRNPLAVLCSVVSTWIKGRYWFGLSYFEQNLISAPQLLLDGIRILGDQALVLHYEQLLEDPAGHMQRICDQLGLAYVTDMVEYGRKNLPRWQLGDLETVYKRERPDRRIGERWTATLERPQVWRLAHDYLHMLGETTIGQMGYSFEELQRVIEARRPSRRRLLLTGSLSFLAHPPLLVARPAALAYSLYIDVRYGAETIGRVPE